MPLNVFLGRSTASSWSFGAGANTNFMLFFPVSDNIGGTTQVTLTGDISAGNFGPGTSAASDNTAGFNSSPTIIVDVGTHGKTLKIVGQLVATAAGDYPTLTGSDKFIYANSGGANQTGTTMPSANYPEDIGRAIDDFVWDQLNGSAVYITGGSGSTVTLQLFVLGLPQDQGGLGGPADATLGNQNYRIYQGFVTRFDWKYEPGQSPHGPINFEIDFQVGNVGGG